MRLRNVLPIAAIIIAVVIILSLKGCNSGEAGAPTDVPGTAETAIHETANHTGEDPTNYESSEAGNSPVSESTHESTEPNTEETTKAGTAEPTPTEPKPTEPKPTNPAPTEPKPTEPKPTEPKPTEPAPTEPKPTNPVHTHSWSAWNQSKAPTCGAEGAEVRSCSRCGVSESRSVPATGAHSWSETAPTCTEAGSKTCKVCGKSESGSTALGHDWVHHDEEGHWRDVLTCYCGQVFYSYEEWYVHSNENWSDEHCGYSDYNEWIVDKPAYDSCSRCGATR